MTLKVSHSGMQDYRACPHLYYLSRVAEVVPVEVKRAPEFGSCGHNLLEDLTRDGPADSIDCGHATLSKEDNILLECLMMAYQVRWGRPDGEAEKEFDVPILAPGGEVEPGIRLRGFIDVLAKDHIMDHKFTSANLTPTYIKSLQRNPQAEEYLLAAREMGSDATYAVWDIIKSKPYKRRLMTPEGEREFYKRDCKGGKKGDPKPGTYLADETWGEFRQRIVDDIAANPDDFFCRVELHKTEEELDRRRYDIWACAKQIQHSTEIGAFPRNEQRCAKFGGCEYQPICWEGVDPEQSELYTIGRKGR